MLLFPCIQQRSTCQEKDKNPNITLLHTPCPWVPPSYKHNATLTSARFSQLAEVPRTGSPVLQGITCSLQESIAHKHGEDTLHPWSRLLLKMLSSTGTSLDPWLSRRASYFTTVDMRLPEHSLYLINLCWLLLMASSFMPGNGFKEVFGIFPGTEVRLPSPPVSRSPPCRPSPSPQGPRCFSAHTFVPSSFWHAPGKIQEGQRRALAKGIWRVTGSPNSNPHWSFRTALSALIALAWRGCSKSFKGLPAVTRTVKSQLYSWSSIHSAATQLALKKPGYTTDPQPATPAPHVLFPCSSLPESKAYTKLQWTPGAWVRYCFLSVQHSTESATDSQRQIINYSFRFWWLQTRRAQQRLSGRFGARLVEHSTSRRATASGQSSEGETAQPANVTTPWGL